MERSYSFVSAVDLLLPLSEVTEALRLPGSKVVAAPFFRGCFHVLGTCGEGVGSGGKTMAEF